MKNLKSYKCICVNGKSERLHRILMEQHLGRKLLPTELVHHDDGDKWNNNIDNLVLTNRPLHAKIHISNLLSANIQRKKGAVVKCSLCGKERYLPLSILNRTSKNYKCSACIKSAYNKAS